MLIDGAQPADTHVPPKLMEHPGGGQRVSQPGEASPRRLFGQLPHQQIEGMCGRQHCQQMGAPQLRRTQCVSPPASKLTRTNLGKEIIRDVRTHQFEQAIGTDGRQH
jgi:hypothetical protein